jgi:hypothetical protein
VGYAPTRAFARHRLRNFAAKSDFFASATTQVSADAVHGFPGAILADCATTKRALKPRR